MRNYWQVQGVAGWPSDDTPPASPAPGEIAPAATPKTVAILPTVTSITSALSSGDAYAEALLRGGRGHPLCVAVVE